MRLTLTAMLLATFVLAGCGDDDLFKPRGRSMAPEAVGVAVDPFSPPPPVAAPKPPTPAPATPDPAAVPAPPPPPPPQAPAAATETGAVPQPQESPREDVVRKEAGVGVGKKGHYSRGIITTPLSVYFRAQERITFNIQIPSAMKTYKAINGHYPRSMEEFTNEILKPARIDLPELPQGHRYAYDPEKGELLVEHPRP